MLAMLTFVTRSGIFINRLPTALKARSLMTDDLHVALGRKIREKRQDSGLTQAQLADRIRISRTSLTNMELGRQRLLVDQLYKMADVLSTSAKDLLPEREEIKTANSFQVN